MGRVESNDSYSQTSPGTLECPSRSAEQKTPNSRFRMESPSGRSGPSGRALGQADGRSVCLEAQFQNGNVHVPGSRTGDLESGQPGPVVGGVMCVCIPPTSLIWSALSK